MPYLLIKIRNEYKWRSWLLLVSIFLLHGYSFTQNEKIFNRADTLRGSNTTERAWWDILYYDLSVRPDYINKTISGHNTITYSVLQNNVGTMMQIDMKKPLQMDSIVLNGSHRLFYTREENVFHVQMPDQLKSSVHKISLYFSGIPKESKRAPWDAGWTWTKDSLGRPWMTVTCQGEGASVWYPCKDFQYDEPDHGARIAMIVPDTLIAIANGRLQSQVQNSDGTATFTWAVVNPISNYCIIPYIGKYVNFSEKYKGKKGMLDVNYWVLDYNVEKAKSYMPPEVHRMFMAFEHWFGPYPFYEDGYQLIETSNTGMEHQSAVSYGNGYKPGYRGRDGSGSGWGLKWDFIIIHESGHEWFGNNITTRDLADMWVHEGFTNYSETLFIEYFYGKDAADVYNAGIRRGIRNDKPVTGKYNVNDQGSGDMYPKPSNMLHSIRHGLDNDNLFRKILTGMNKKFYHKIVTSSQVENYISSKAKFMYNKVFDQYLRSTQIPSFEYYFSGDHQNVFYRYSNCIPGFNLPLTLKSKEGKIKIYPTSGWQKTSLRKNQITLFDKAAIEKMYYLTVYHVNP